MASDLAPPRGDDALAVLTSCFAAELGAETALLTRWNDAKQVAVPLSQSGLALELDQHVFTRQRGFAGRAVDAGAPFFEELAPGEPHCLDAAIAGRRVTVGLGAPIMSPMGVRGSLTAGFASGPDGHARVMLEAAASYAALAGLCLDHSTLLLKRLLLAARYDELTGLLNYSSLREALGREIERSKRHRGPLSCCFVDLDKFKRVNDGGHAKGNTILAIVGAAISDSARKSDHAARYGGDEFVLLLPETPWQEAKVLALRVQEAIRERTLLQAGEQVTASIGVSQWVDGWSPETLLADADHALMRAKARPASVVVSPLVWVGAA